MQLWRDLLVRNPREKVGGHSLRVQLCVLSAMRSRVNLILRFLIALKFQHSNKGYLLIQLVGVDVLVIQLHDGGKRLLDRRVALELAMLQDLLDPWVHVWR